MSNPACPNCYYNLSGIPIENDQYQCPECGNSLTTNEAYQRPHYIVSTNKPILIGSLPFVIALAILLVPPFLMSTASARGGYMAGFILFTPATLLWPFFTSMHYAIKVKQYKGPDKRRGPFATFLVIWFSATAILCAALIPAWLLGFVIFAGSSF